MTPKNPVATRSALLRALVESAEREKGPTYDVPYQGERKILRRIKVETSLPLYRLQNGRTHKAQTEYLEKHPDLPPDFFEDPEDPRAQEAQGEILLSLIDERELAKDLDERGQHTPLVLTIDGIVLDGNRRLAAMRKSGMTHASAVVLPETAQANDIYETELELQMQRDTKAPYDWVNNALHIEFGIKRLGASLETMAKRTRTSIEDVKTELKMLEMAKLYLVWSGHEGQFHRIPSPAAGGNSEQAFRELALKMSNSSLLRKTNESHRRLIRDACFQSIKDEKGYQDVRDIIRQLTQNLSRVKERLAERIPEQLSFTPIVPSNEGPRPDLNTNPPSAAAEEDPLLALAGEAADPGPDVASLEDVVSDDKGVEQLLEVIAEVSAEERESKRLPIQRLQRALNELRQIELAPGSSELDGIARALSDLIHEAERLAKRVDNLRHGD